MPFDLARSQVSISASRIRQSIEQHWDLLANVTKRDYLMRVCIIGPESTGKSTLAQALAAHYQTVWVPEYARRFIETCGDATLADMAVIARGQQALEALQIPQANRLLFADTDAVATMVWSQWLHGVVPAEVESLAKSDVHDLYLLTDNDLPWVADQVRYFPEGGAQFLADCKHTLERLGRPYHLIQGQDEQRLRRAIEIVDREKVSFFRRAL